MGTFNIYSLYNIGLTEAQLIAIRDSAIAELASGKVITSVNAPGLTTTFQVYATPIELAQAATFALQQISGSYGTPVINQTFGYVP